jgi:exodeoxyribonuclease VII large subunit
VAVQGDNAPAEIAEGIEMLNRIGGVDVIIAGRGGGSLEELWAFNTEVVARSIFNSQVPVISAVGHEVDYTIADFVADIRAATPSAAAELAVPDMMTSLRHIRNLQNRLQSAMHGYIDRQRNRLDICQKHHILQNPYDYLNQRLQQLDYLNKFLARNMENIFTRKKELLATQAAKLNSLSPLATLERGYSISTKDNQVIRDAASLNRGDKIQVILNKGKLNCEVLDKED